MTKYINKSKLKREVYSKVHRLITCIQLNIRIKEGNDNKQLSLEEKFK